LKKELCFGFSLENCYGRVLLGNQEKERVEIPKGKTVLLAKRISYGKSFLSRARGNNKEKDRKGARQRIVSLEW